MGTETAFALNGAAIALPGGLPLVLSGLLALGLIGRRHRIG
ncbi:hypothetical protein [Roseisalinus antarcticus]|uniref:Uncharacterized protein n=1 Tax=Roseisalinus antarcticus TaxID=254357 RepID=A0A1Y5STL9_9RHOB|nr:hypothetical protein [Roseisalinus antarcticus]SLN47562.1 hypothetical protein ROA7023_02009 [Roseisalinus antarcticus]